MKNAWPTNLNEVDHLLLNARLRDELEPFMDESVDLVDVRSMPTPQENEFLASMLAWERAPASCPVMPLSRNYQWNFDVSIQCDGKHTSDFDCFDLIAIHSIFPRQLR